MDTGNWIAIAVGAVSVGAAGISMHQAASSKRSATAALEQAQSAKEQARSARDQAEAAREANQLTHLQIQRADRQEHAADQQENAAAQRAAEAVHLKVAARSSDDTLVVSIDNKHTQPITHVKIMDSRADGEAPQRGWQGYRSLPSKLRQTSWAHIAAAGSVQTALRFTDENGDRLPLPTDREVKVRFRDANGQWWMTSSATGPRRIAEPDPAG
jgi:hypothetical protein